MDFVEAIKVWRGCEAVLRHIKQEQINVPDLDQRIENARKAMDDAAQVIVQRYLAHIVEHDLLNEDIVLPLKTITHLTLHIGESGSAEPDLWDKSLRKRMHDVEEAQAVQDGYCAMFSDVVKDNSEVRTMIENRHCDLVKAQRDLLIGVLQAAESGHESNVLMRAYNMVR